MSEETQQQEAPREPSRVEQFSTDVGLERLIQRLRNKEFLRQFVFYINVVVGEREKTG